MTIWIGLFRGINLGGNRMPMKDLVKVMEAAGMTQVRTYIASGNVVFRSDKDEEALRQEIEDLVADNFGFRSRLFLRQAHHLQQVVERNPYPYATEGKHVLVLFCHAHPRAAKLDELTGMLLPREAFELIDDVFYLYCPEGQADSKVAVKVDKLLGVHTTGRNLNTVKKLLEMAGEKA